MCRTHVVEHKSCDEQAGATIKARALHMCQDVDAANTDDGPSSEKQICLAIDRIYGFLSVVDGKANSLITLNSFIVAIAGLLVFEPLSEFSPVDPVWTAVKYVCLISGVLAILVAGFSVFKALRIYHIRWGYMDNYAKDADGSAFERELDLLCRETAYRQRTVRHLRTQTLIAFWLVTLALAGSLIRIF